MGSTLVAASLAAAGLANGCSPPKASVLPDISCGAVSTCPNDPPPTQYDTDKCQADLDGTCGSAYRAYDDCFAAARVCAYDGTTDVFATEAACGDAGRGIAACADAGTPGDAGPD